MFSAGATPLVELVTMVNKEMERSALSNMWVMLERFYTISRPVHDIWAISDRTTLAILHVSPICWLLGQIWPIQPYTNVTPSCWSFDSVAKLRPKCVYGLWYFSPGPDALWNITTFSWQDKWTYFPSCIEYRILKYRILMNYSWLQSSWSFSVLCSSLS